MRGESDGPAHPHGRRDARHPGRRATHADAHADAHVAVALDGLGRRLGHKKTVPSTKAGYAALVAWAEEFGALDRAGAEGSGSFGVGLVRFLRARGAEVVEVNRPNPQHRRRFAKKHDTADAEAAARALQADTATGEAKSADGPAQMVRALHLARRSAVKARTQAANQLHACSSPHQKKSLGRSCAAFPRPSWSQSRRASVRAAFPKICGGPRAS